MYQGDPNKRKLDVSFASRQEAELYRARVQQPTYTRFYTVEPVTNWTKKEVLSNGHYVFRKVLTTTYYIIETLGVNDRAYTPPKQKRGE